MGALITFASAFAGIAAFVAAETLLSRAEKAETEGRLTAVAIGEVKAGRGGARVTFIDGNGKAHGAPADESRLSPGMEVAVRYDPEDPDHNSFR